MYNVKLVLLVIFFNFSFFVCDDFLKAKVTTNHLISTRLYNSQIPPRAKTDTNLKKKKRNEKKTTFFFVFFFVNLVGTL